MKLRVTIFALMTMILASCVSSNSIWQRHHSLYHKKTSGLFMQQEDYSCGAASLASLLHYYFKEDMDESRMLDYIKELFGPKAYKVIETDGLSFLELEQIAASLDYQFASVKLDVDMLPRLTGPVIVFLERRDYKHFAVFRGIVEDRVFLADPSRGNIRQPLSVFLQEWDGRTFVLGKKGFVPDAQHTLAIKHSWPLRNELIALRSKLNRVTPIPTRINTPAFKPE